MEIICKQCSKTCRANLNKRGDEFVVVGACPHCGHQNVIQRNDPRFEELTKGKFPEWNIPPMAKPADQQAAPQMVTVTSRKSRQARQAPPNVVEPKADGQEKLEPTVPPLVDDFDFAKPTEATLSKPANGTPVDPPKSPRKSTPKPGNSRNGRK